MKEEDKLRLFKEVLEEDYGQSEHYDKIVHQMLRIREIFIRMPVFKKLSFANQYGFCYATNLMVNDTSLEHVREMRIFKKEKKSTPAFSINKGFEKKPIVPIDGFQNLKLSDGKQEENPV